MFIRSDVERLTLDMLRREQWCFALSDSGLVSVRSYTLCERPSRRHAYRVVSRYDRLDGRGTDLKVPPLPGSVRDEGLRAICAQIIYDGAFPVQGE